MRKLDSAISNTSYFGFTESHLEVRHCRDSAGNVRDFDELATSLEPLCRIHLLFQFRGMKKS